MNKDQNHCDIDAYNIVISKLVETKTNSKHLIGCLYKVVMPLVSILPKMIGYVKKFPVKDGDKDKNKKLMSFHIDYEKLLEKYETFWNEIGDYWMEWFTSLLYRYIKTKIRTWW